MRAFIAVELPAEIRCVLAHLQSQLAAARADVKWTEEDNLHITMRFLGEITEGQRQRLEALLREIAAQTNTIPIALTNVGAFPSMTSPRVLWVGIGEGSSFALRASERPLRSVRGAGQEALTNIAEEIERGVVSLGFEKEDHPFSAHVTLGRVRSPKNRAALVAVMRELAWTPPQPFAITCLTLFQSTLTSSGPIYASLSKVPFIKK